ncbi:MAG TPA: acyltransferase [Candidatus Limnocylindrales bacterium]|nr:acyltransferase [Candidatus Limnocylindrales bacterium]
MTDRPRLVFLDNLRASVILLVIVLHASISYMLYGPPWWYVVDPDQGLEFTALVLLVDVPLMPILFFVAGYLALPSLRRHGTGAFVRGKLVRLGAPWVFGVVVLAPLITYVGYLSRGVPTGYLEFWTGDFWGPMFQQAVYWFLGVLLALFLLLAWAWEASPRLQGWTPTPSRPGPWFFPAFVALSAVGAILFSPVNGLDDWVPFGWLFVVQPARLGFYAGYLVLGIVAERRGWLGPGGYQPDPPTWVAGAVATGIAYLAYRLTGSLDTAPERIVAGLLFSAFCLSALMAGVAGFARWGSWTGRTWRALAANSFGIYYVHPLILYPLAWGLVGVPLPPLAKVVILVVVTACGSLALSALVLRRVPGVRRAF